MSRTSSRIPAEEESFEPEPTEVDDAQYYGVVAFVFFGIVGGFIVGVDLLNLLQAYEARKKPTAASDWRVTTMSSADGEKSESFPPWPGKHSQCIKEGATFLLVVSITQDMTLSDFFDIITHSIILNN